ncbi:hypothetical protein BC6307_05220 [Sutcliffiella cohnii]|uniref:precorrin-2 dehydrogenase n=1 Tax=Sutcliffiella cohnii TaxID=33932 RepID=A0A223KMZ3_9BACI|nr:bifunctional precorrin-2 dehydrogenase/sirohydrochlorin ferrochelatase [Sutcliffiella cohnii]AST90724.1 hypothetical protein BC6307_05220 [Sutcliffiella cohnii]
MTTPLMIKLDAKKCVIFGGGKVATRKVKFLLEEGADLTIISENISEELQALIPRFHYVNISINNFDEILTYIPTNCFLAVVATNNRELNERIANKVSIHVPLINIVDNQYSSNFYFPAYIKQGHLKIAVSTSGASPKLAKTIKQHLQKEFGPEYKDYLEQLQTEREWALRNLHTETERKAHLQKITKFPLNKER